jgi:altronate dehydratase
MREEKTQLSPAERRFVLADPRDNVATALVSLRQGDLIAVPEIHGELVLEEDIPSGHKFALRVIRSGRPVVKFGEYIGYATASIEPGTHVHVHNLRSAYGRSA